MATGGCEEAWISEDKFQFLGRKRGALGKGRRDSEEGAAEMKIPLSSFVEIFELK